MPYRPTIVTRNAAHCHDCDTVVESRSRHDFRECKCGNIFVDGGFDYIRIGHRNSNWTNLSKSHEGPETLYDYERQDESS